MLTIERVYKNAAGDTLRTDTIIMEATQDTLVVGTAQKTYFRRLFISYTYGPADRDVGSIELVTNADSVETSSGGYLWAEWTDYDVLCDMSDLPVVGDPV